jgi:peptide-methionine (S)-S-oxide reductase
MRFHAICAGLIPGLLFSITAFAAADTKYEEAIFAGGCFWCMEGPYDKLDGVISTTSGYTDGHVKNPTYKQVSSGSTGHTEALKVVYDPAKVSYDKLLDVFWVNIDPLTANAQFCDHGSQYRSGIYYRNDKQKSAALASLKRIQEKFNEPVVTEIDPASTFYPAEDYHQDYYMKNPVRYKYYRWRCGRDQRLKELWGDEAAADEH